MNTLIKHYTLDNTQFNKFVLDAIDADSYGEKLTTDKQKLTFLIHTFNSEYVHDNTIAQYGSIKKAFASWLQGLPSAINLPYSYFDIINLYKSMENDLYWDDLTENMQDKYLAKYWDLISDTVFSLCDENNIDY